jgi:hypothetical protein
MKTGWIEYLKIEGGIHSTLWLGTSYKIANLKRKIILQGPETVGETLTHLLLIEEVQSSVHGTESGQSN